MTARRIGRYLAAASAWAEAALCLAVVAAGMGWIAGWLP